jgi:hypothetical protein
MLPDMRTMRVVVLTLLLGLLDARARAWDDFGHIQVAAIAFTRLSPRARQRVEQLLPLNPRYANWIAGFPTKKHAQVAFAKAATWADAIKSDPAYGSDKTTDATAGRNIGYLDKLRHEYWHYIDVPFSPDGTPVTAPAVPNVQTQIHLFLATLADPTVSEDIKSYDLSWLLHLVGDIHQPLHCTSRFDKADPRGDQGGNLVQINGNESPAICDDPRFCSQPPSRKLHIFFDGVLGESCCVDEGINAALQLPSADKHAAKQLDEAVWTQEGFQLATSAVYVPPIGIGDGPFTITPAYAAAALALGKTQVALAGARLANVLNAAFEAEQAAH